MFGDFPLVTDMKPPRLSKHINYAHDGNHSALPTPFAHLIPMSGTTANCRAYKALTHLTVKRREARIYPKPICSVG